MILGYARTSTVSQDLSLQLDALRAAGCNEVLEERGSGARQDRPVLLGALARLRAGDTLITWRLDRLGRSTQQIAAILEDLPKRGVVYRALAEGLDSSTVTGRGMLRVIGAMAEMEQDIIRERVQAGLSAAKERGRIGGRPTALSLGQAEAVRAEIAAGAVSIKRAAARLRVAPRTLRRALDRLPPAP